MNQVNNTTKALSEIAENISRPFDFSEKSEVVFVNTGDVLEGKFLHHKYSNKERLPGQAKKAIKKDDILFSEIRPGNRRFAYVDFDPRDYVVSTKFMVLRADEELILSKFLYYVLTSQQTLREFQMIAESRSGTFPQITFTSVGYYPIFIPPKRQQAGIITFIETLDNKIELNREMNQTLEAIARAIFKSWFVDFDPVRAKAEGRVPVGMDAETAALFPDRLVESELGLIPEGWEVKPLDEIAHYQNGLALQKYPPEGDEFLPVIKIRELRQGYPDDSSGKASPNIKTSCILEDGDIVFSWSASLLVDIWCGGRGALNQHLFKVTSTKYPKWFYYYWTEHHLNQFQRIAAGKATTMGHIKRRHLTEALTVVPPNITMQHMTEIVAPLVDAIVNNRLESHILAEIRDTLLPKLISGQLRVPEMIGQD